MSSLYLPLNDTSVVFLHPDDTGLPVPYAAQITVKSERPTNVGVLASYFLVQKEVSDLILRIVIAHIQESFPPYVVFDDESYTLYASRRKWVYGQTKVRFEWGGRRVAPCEHKWTFLFRCKDEKESSGMKK